MRGKERKFIICLIVGLLACVILTFHMFIFLSNQYLRNNAYSSASDLIEINQQGAVNISALLQRDQQNAREIKKEIERKSFADGNALLQYLNEAKENWQEDEIYIYTDSGRCYDSTGSQNGGIASQRAVDIVTKGESFNALKAQTEYAIAVSTSLTVQDSRIVAVSVLHNLDKLFDTLNLKPYSGQGAIYLTKQSGVYICSAGTGAQEVYNILSNLETGKLEELTGSGTDIETVMANGEDGAYLSSDDSQYIVLTPVTFMGETYYLFEMIPQSIVSTTMNGFTKSITAISVVMVLLMLVLFLSFFFLYHIHARRYTDEIQAREHLFDLLVSRTQNAFLLLEEGAEKPVYVTSNTAAILSDGKVSIQKAGEGYRLSGDGTDPENRVFSEINKVLSKWDGTRELISDYLPYGEGTEQHYLRLSLYPVEGSHREFVGIVQDATHEFEREQRLKDAVSLADSANRAKTGFLSSMSHDIRTPLNAIINMTRFLQNDLDDREKATKEIGVIQDSSEHLLDLINDILDLSRIESGKLTFSSSSFDIRETINSVTEITESLCEAKKQKLLLDIPEISHPEIKGDAIRLSQILINLLNNAVKFTPEGGEIRFSVSELHSIAAGTLPFRFIVGDNGIGIPADRLGYIFDPFTRVENETIRQTEGSGLGLAITRNFVEAQGGRISVDSTPGKGSVFTVEMSFAEGTKTGEQRKPAQASDIRFDGLRALLAEDNAINRSIAETILSSWGFKVESAENGKVAEKLFLEHEEGYYSIIYMDIQMPEMNGYDTAKAIRSSGREDASSIPIIAMTANAFAEDVELARSAGMNGHVAKPINLDELRRVTGQFVNHKGTGAEKVT